MYICTIDDVLDLSSAHDFIAPYEICINSLGLLQFLITDRLFDHRSFTSLYEQRYGNEIFSSEIINLRF